MMTKEEYSMLKKYERPELEIEYDWLDNIITQSPETDLGDEDPLE